MRVLHLLRSPQQRRSIPLLLALLVVSSIFIISHSFSSNAAQKAQSIISIPLQDAKVEIIADLHDNNDDNEKYFEHFKLAGKDSVFAYLGDSIKRIQLGKYTSSNVFEEWSSRNKKQDYILTHWGSSPLADQCKLLVKAMYFGKEDWHAKKIRDKFNEDKESLANFQNTIERLRIYNKCFIENGFGTDSFFEELRDDFGIEVTAKDLQTRMFPFLKVLPVNHTQYMFPTIMNMQTGIIHDQPETTASISEYNSNFLYHWRKASKGKGIVTTMGSHQVPLLKKQLRVWKKLGNTLPIQVTYKANELNETDRAEIKNFVKESGQDVSLIDLDPIMDEEEASKKIQRFNNKFLAFLFNTFEEIIFIDVDAVSFVDPLRYFEMDTYKKSGLRLWRDRRGNTNSHGQQCNGILQGIEPSFEEHLLLGSNMHLKPSDPRIKKSTDPYAILLNDYFERHIIHHAESGLIVANKVQKFASFIAAFYLNINAHFGWCSYGDKETFWMGPLIMGMEFYMDPMGAAAVGKVVDQKDKEGKMIKAVCSTQMGHLDDDMNLLWVNGGLRTCKLDDGAVEDFKKDEEYFRTKFGTVEHLRDYYASPLEIDGFIVPDLTDLKWYQAKECRGYVHCASARVNGHSKDAYIGILDPEKKEIINDYVKAYNGV